MPIPCVFLPANESTIGSMEGWILSSLFFGSGASPVDYPLMLLADQIPCPRGLLRPLSNWQGTVAALLQKPFMHVHYFLQRTAGNCARRTLDARL